MVSSENGQVETAMTVAELIKELEAVRHPEAEVELYFHQTFTSAAAQSVQVYRCKYGDDVPHWRVFISTGKEGEQK